MSKFLARFAAAALLVTGIFAGGSGPANAAPPTQHGKPTGISTTFDTGWG